MSRITLHNLVLIAMGLITITAHGADGPGEIVATDNGDPRSFEPFAAAAKPAFNGLCLAIVPVKQGQHGTITLSTSAQGLARGSISIAGIGQKDMP